MPDIALRFNKDMLVLSAPIDTCLARQGIDVEQDREFISLIEPEAVGDAYRLELVAGAQCLVTNTAGITQARLAHHNLDDRAPELAHASLTIINSLKPQHVFAEIGPTRLPLDPSSAVSLKQNRDQYAQAALAFGEKGFDAFFLNGMTDPADMQCALMGIRKECDTPIFASMNIDGKKFQKRGERLTETFLMMAEYGADVVGFSTQSGLSWVLEIIEEHLKPADVPMIVQLVVGSNNPKQQESTEENPYYCPDTMIEASVLLRDAGVQFLRAEGAATPAYTTSLAIASSGFDVMLDKGLT